VGHLLDGVPCDCDAQLLRALGLIEREGAGVIVCTHIGGERDAARTLARIVEHLDPLASMGAEQSPSAEPEIREFGAAAQILLDLGLTRLRLLTNNPRKIVGIEAYGLRVTERIPVDVAATPSRVGFLEMQRERLGHLHARFKG
jgi:3,4-dihydroxy 2-butanone 4-phosphate synthase/GTP cyclohydrolase II